MSDCTQAQGRKRRWLEAGGWVLLIAVLWGADLLAKIAEREQAGYGKDDFRLVSEQVTSGLAVLAMIPFVLRWLSIFPLRRNAWTAAVIGHTAGTAWFAFGHQALMIVLRVPWYALNGIEYVWREPFVANLLVEYQKDIKVYFGIVLVATAWRLYRDRSGGPVTEDRRLVVQTARGVSVLPYDRIDYLQAARNYVAVHSEGREYLVRETFSNIMDELAGSSILRCHRSYAVNADRIREVLATGGGPRVRLESGDEVPLGRGYREEFNRRLRSGKLTPAAD